MLFLEATDDVLVRRFEAVRRPHPLQGDGRLLDGIARERELLRDLRGDADLVIDTSDAQRAPAAAAGRRRRSATSDDPALQVDRGVASATSTACRSTPTWSSTAVPAQPALGARAARR